MIPKSNLPADGISIMNQFPSASQSVVQPRLSVGSAQAHVWLDALPAGPRLVEDSREAGPDWSCFAWNRRMYEQVLGQPFQSGAGL